MKILEMKDILEMQNILLVHSFLKGKLLKSFEFYFQKSSNVHSKPILLSSSEWPYIPHFKSVTNCMNSITNAYIHSWNVLIKDVVKPSTLWTNELMSNNASMTTKDYYLFSWATIIHWSWTSSQTFWLNKHIFWKSDKTLFSKFSFFPIIIFKIKYKQESK